MSYALANLFPLVRFALAQHSHGTGTISVAIKSPDSTRIKPWVAGGKNMTPGFYILYCSGADVEGTMCNKMQVPLSVQLMQLIVLHCCCGDGMSCHVYAELRACALLLPACTCKSIARHLLWEPELR